jgi:dTDP-glucose pyrophosphorylase
VSVTKALILARGLGTRMRTEDAGVALDPRQAAAAGAGLKAMMPFGRPFLDHVLHAAADAGLSDIGLVVAPGRDAIRTYYENLQTSRLAISFVTQAEPLGTADAVLSAEDWAAGEPFVAMNSDNLYPVDVLSRLVAADGPALPGFAAGALEIPMARLGAFALVEVDSRGCLSRIVEKPGEMAMAAAGPEALISMNVWRFDERIFEACRRVPVSARGEKELPQAVGMAADGGVCFEVIPVKAPVVDLSTRRDIAAVAERLQGARVEL